MSAHPADAISLAQVSPESMDHDELVAEVRRLRLRLEALREQRDERIAQLQELDAQLNPADSPLAAARQRAEQAEAHLAALLNTRSMRALRLPRAVYAKVRTARGRTGGAA